MREEGRAKEKLIKRVRKEGRGRGGWEREPHHQQLLHQMDSSLQTIQQETAHRHQIRSPGPLLPLENEFSGEGTRQGGAKTRG